MLWLETPFDWIIFAVTVSGLLVTITLLVVAFFAQFDEYQYNDDDENDYGKGPS